MKSKEKPPLSPLEEIDCKTVSRFGRLLRPKGMSSRLRIKGDDRNSTYHAMSRAAGGEFLFDDVAKEALRKLIWKMAAFSGVEVLTSETVIRIVRTPNLGSELLTAYPQ